MISGILGFVFGLAVMYCIYIFFGGVWVNEPTHPVYGCRGCTKHLTPPARWLPVEPGGEALGDVNVTDGKFVCLGYYRNGWACGYCSLVYRGTHYMLLPDPPKETK